MHTHDSEPFDLLAHIEEEHPEAPEQFASVHDARGWHNEQHGEV